MKIFGILKNWYGICNPRVHIRGGALEETLSGEGGTIEKTCIQVQQMFGY
jgi:hypothetical protein